METTKTTISPARGPKGTPSLTPSSKTLKDWFLQLSLEERARVVQVEHKESISLIRKMYAYQKEKKQGLFFDIDQDVGPGKELLSNKILKKVSSPETNFMTLDELYYCMYPDHWMQVLF
jgi:hypothetical protein